MLLKFIWICIIFILVSVGFIFYKQQHFSVNMFTQAQEAVKGISTSKSEQISNQLKEEVDNGFNHAQRQVLNLKVSDIYSFFNKGQKITGDFQAFQENLKRDIENLNKNK
jgi:hypothetical protein